MSIFVSASTAVFFSRKFLVGNQPGSKLMVLCQQASLLLIRRLRPSPGIFPCDKIVYQGAVTSKIQGEDVGTNWQP